MDDEKKIICPSCGAMNGMNDRFCGSCGASLADAKANIGETVAEEVKEAEPVVEATPVVEPVAAPVAEPANVEYYNDDTSSSETADKQATASMILGIVGLVLCCCMPCGVAGLILAILAKKNGATGGKVTAGLVMSIIVLAIWLISLVISLASGSYGAYVDMINEMM